MQLEDRSALISGANFADALTEWLEQWKADTVSR